MGCISIHKNLANQFTKGLSRNVIHNASNDIVGDPFELFHSGNPTYVIEDTAK